MSIALLKNVCLVVFLGACASSSKNSKPASGNNEIDTDSSVESFTGPDQKPLSLMDLPQAQYGGFVLSPGFYEAEFKT